MRQAASGGKGGGGVTSRHTFSTFVLSIYTFPTIKNACDRLTDRARNDPPFPRTQIIAPVDYSIYFIPIHCSFKLINLSKYQAFKAYIENIGYT